MQRYWPRGSREKDEKMMLKYLQCIFATFFYILDVVNMS